MKMGKDKRIALVIKTSGLEYDDRVRKEILSVQKLFPFIRFKIFVMLPDNREYEGVTDYGVPFKAVYVPARDKFPSSQKAVLKAWQFKKSIEKDLRMCDAVWCANDDTAAVVALTKNKRVLWDLHEIPSTLVGGRLRRTILKLLLSRCKVVVHANPQRKHYLESIGVISQPNNHFVLRNYPNFEDEDKVFDEKYCHFISWKSDRKCIYLQGLTNDSRSAYETIAAVMRFPSLCAVVVGGFDPVAKNRLSLEFAEEFNNRILVVGSVAQLKIPQYVKQCFLSLVFYKNVSPNNWYCEANRFYQSVILGLPVVTGNNPSMKELVNQFGFGVSIEDDGKDINKIAEGINHVLENYDEYLGNTVRFRNVLLWKNQEMEIEKIIDTLFN